MDTDKLADKMKLSWVQTMLLYLSVTIGIFTVALPALTAAPYPNRDLWLVPFLMVPGVLVVGSIAVRLGLFFPRQTIIEYSKTLTGPFIGTMIALTYISWYTCFAALNLRLTSDFFITGFLPDTPVSVITGAMVVTSAYAARHGYQVLARVNQLLIPFIVGLVWVLFFLSLPEIKLANLSPIMAGGINHLVHNTIVPFSVFSDIVNIVMLIPYLTEPNQAPRVVRWGVTVSGLHLLVFIFTVIAVFGIDAAKTLVYPGLSLSRQIDIANFIQRVEIAILVILLGGIFVRTSLGLLWASLAVAQAFNLNRYEPVVFPLALLASAMAFLLGDSTLEYTALFKPGFIAPYSLVHSLAIPLLLLLLAYLKMGRPSPSGTPVHPDQGCNETADAR